MALLRFTCKDANVTVGISGKYDNVFKYRKNGTGDWTDFTSVGLTSEDYIELKGNGFDANTGYDQWGINYSIFRFNGDGKIEASGDVTSLLNSEGGDVTIIKQDQFRNMFLECTNLTKAPDLPSSALSMGCYSSMFQGCTNLITVPAKIPATTLSESCCNKMFYGCTNLKNAPELPATTLAIDCYNNMFYGCTSLITAPELPATTLALRCYLQMFYQCTSLTTAPTKIPAAELPNQCCYQMFYYCTNLKNAPEFSSTSALGNQCCYQMFYGCTSLVEAPTILPATILGNQCYAQMFQGCTSLITAPKLPATTLAPSCYSNMFQGCENLTTAPELPATTLVDSCYMVMFNGCTKLNYVKIGAESPSQLNQGGWLYNVAPTGTLEVTNDVLLVQAGNPSSLPQGWELVRTSSIKDKLIGYIKVCGRKLEDINSTDDIVIIDNPHIYNVNERLHIDATNLTINGKKVVMSFDDSSDLKEGHLLTKDDIGKKIIIKVEQI